MRENEIEKSEMKRAEETFENKSEKPLKAFTLKEE